ncbi:cat eye syndrome critical region protein 2 [Cocos nucifera]|uniref:Cat eye syndrome critical region protein 2 n=1 Tax=Cocos nucifera TaxID=13894 RepID=A0A8K0IMN0_COCNU|nr:cat eye syndrome critical region protein 2 [Cocos nucifera]
MGSSNKPAAEKKRKKKGRPSLLDLQKRSLRLQKQQQEKEKSNNRNPNPNPNSNPYLRFPSSSSSRRITRRNPHPEAAEPQPPRDAAAAEDDEEEAESSGGKRREKKLKLVLHLPPGRSGNSNSGSDSDGDAGGAARRKRKIDAVGSHGDRDKAERHNSSKAMDSLQGEPSDSGPTTPLPDKKLLVFILDRLQKKDTYGVFSEPVDPNELPDYHEVIKHPMDFGTVRKKLSSGAYANLEQFEKDVFLICSNAMRYNAPDTIYYRQARSIHELAKKNFENLRQESDDNEPEPKTVVRRGRPPNKNKRPVGRPAERATSDFSSDATLANAGDGVHWSNMAHDLSRKGSVVDKSVMMASHGLHNIDMFSLGERKSERNEEYSGSAFKGISTKYGKKLTVIDENRRNTFKQPQQFTSVCEPPVLTTFDGDRKQLVPIGLHMEYSYSRSLARFAANLGYIGWAIAAKKIERALPPGTKFGPGWVGDGDAPQRSQPPLLSASSPHPSSQPIILPCTTISRSDKLPQRLEPPSNDSAVEEAHLRRTLPPASTSAAANRPPDIEGPVPSRGSHLENGLSALSGVGGGDANRFKVPFQLHQNTGMQATVNGFNNVFKMSSQFGKMLRPTRTPGSFGSDVQMTHGQALDMVSRSSNSLIHQVPISHLDAEKAKPMAGYSNTINSGNPLPDSGLSQGSWQGMSLQPKSDSVPPDLNVGFQSPGSPTSGMLVDSQQPDLALQL